MPFVLIVLGLALLVLGGELVVRGLTLITFVVVTVRELSRRPA